MKHRSLPILAVIPLVLAACSSGPSASVTASVAESIAPSEAASAAASPDASATIKPLASEEGVLTIWVDGGRVEAITALGEQFTETYDVPVAVQELGFGDIRDQLKITGPVGEGPDIIIGAHDWLGELVSNGLLLPLDLGDTVDQIDPVAVTAFTYEGELYGLPYNTEAIALYYNTDLVPEPPATWDDLKRIAKELQDEGTVEQGYVLQQGDPYHTYPIVTGFGGYVFGRDADGNYDPSDLGLDTDGGIAAMTEIDAMVKAGLLRQDVDYETMMTLFKEGKSAMFITGPWALGDVRAAGVNYGVAPIPMMVEEPRPFVGSQGFMVSAFGKNQPLAQAFLTEFLATDEAMLALYDAVPASPAWLPVRDQVDDPDLAAFAASAANGEPMPAIPEMSAVWEAWGKAVTLIFQQQQAPESAISEAADTIRATIEGQ